MQLAGVGIALSVYSTVTKLFNVPLLSVATSSVATAYGEHEGDALHTHLDAAHMLCLNSTARLEPIRLLNQSLQSVIN